MNQPSWKACLLIILSGWAVLPWAAASEDKHWAFLPLTENSRGSIDDLVAQEYPRHGLVPNGPAPRSVLIRRLSYDLTGLPPSLTLLAQFEHDQRPDALARLVDLLLATPQYGERWGRFWLDVVRYADTAGDNADYPVPELHRYRDYVIDAFNTDKPFDQFAREQIAGDLLPHDDDEQFVSQTIATGFLALSRRYGTMPYELWHLTLEDAIDTVGQAFLGMTWRCARCHDHKFDPITTEEYYGLYGIFASSQYPWAGGEELQSKQLPRAHFVPLVRGGPLAEARSAQQTAEQLLERQISAASSDAERKPLQRSLEQLRRSSLPQGMAGAYAIQEGAVRDARLQIQGDPQLEGEVIPRAVPHYLPIARPTVPSSESGRRQLAEWITARDNPLFARVIVNRVWQHLFDVGIVGTPSNFGLRGSPPSHRALLDYLASELVRHDFALKPVLRQIVLSDTYQLSSDDNEPNAQRDPSNRFLWRHPRRRLDAESLRDSILAVNGCLDLARPGPHPFPAMQDWNWTQHHAFQGEYASRHRSLYVMTQRLQRHRFLALFDGPDTNTSTDARPTSTVPAQALYMANNPWMREQATTLARHILHTPAKPLDDATYIRELYRAALRRDATPQEQASWMVFLTRLRQVPSRGPSADQAQDGTSVAHVLLCCNEFLYID